MAYEVNLPAGRGPTTYTASWSTTGRHVRQRLVPFPQGNQTLDSSNRPVWAQSFSPSGVGGTNVYRFNYGGTTYDFGSTVDTQNGGDCSVRIYKTGGTSSTVHRTNSVASGQEALKEYSSETTVTYTWPGSMVGYYSWCTVPTAPQGISVSRSGTSVQVGVTVGSASDGGTGITYYTVQRSSDGATLNNWGTFTGHSLGQTYYFRAWAGNAVGASLSTGWTAIYIPNVPNAPYISSVTRSGRKHTINFSTPADNGAYIDKYDAYYSKNGGGWTFYGTVYGSFQTGDLDLGSTYNWKVFAHNEMGWSGESNNVSQTIPNVPNQVGTPTVSKRIVSLSGLNNTISWTAPSNNGAAITSYQVQWSTNNSTWTSLGTTTSTSINHDSLSPGTTYYYQVRAYNEMGWGSYSGSGSRYNPKVPTNPVITEFIRVVGDIRKLKMTWTASSFDGAVASGYDIQSSYSDNGSTGWSAWINEITDTALTSYTSADLLIVKYYKFRIRAQSDSGDSAWVESPILFISAYGYRATGGNWNTPIANAKRYLNGQWVPIANVKKWVNGEWKVLEK